MDSDATHGTKESNPSDDNSLDVTVQLQNIADNMLFRPNADFIVEWNHERNEVPELLASHGVPLELWQKWFDQMEIFWKDRIDKVVSKMLTTWSKQPWLLIPFVCLLSFFFFAFKTEEEVEKAWIDFVSDLNAGKCQQLGLHVKILRYHLDMIAEGNKYYVPFGIQFSSLSERNLTNVGFQGFQCNENTMMGNNLSKALTSTPSTSFRVEPQNIVNNSYFVPGRNFKVEFEHERHEVPSFLQHHGITLHLWQSWFDKMHDLWAKDINIERKIQLPVAWMRFVSDLRENECKKHGLSVESIQYELLFKVPSEDGNGQVIKRTIPVGLKFSKAPASGKDLYNLEGEIGPLNVDTCSNSEASSYTL